MIKWHNILALCLSNFYTLFGLSASTFLRGRAVRRRQAAIRQPARKRTAGRHKNFLNKVLAQATKSFIFAPFIAACWGVFLFLPFASRAQTHVFAVAPKITDSRIDTALNDHYAFINRSAQPRRALVVFFPGTGAEPRNYRAFPTLAANLGFHAVGLMYPNDETVNGRCGLTTDLDCMGAIRAETLDGIDRTPRATVNRPNSIENRLVALLQYLHAQNPHDDWAQFLELNSAGEFTPRWSAIVVAGHSQGGGYAGYIATVRRTRRAIMFGAMDYNGVVRRLANWMTAPKLTPDGEFFAMGHLRDELVNYGILSGLAWSAYRIPDFGAPVNADTASAPFAQTRSFFTNAESTALGALFTVAPLHNVPVVDVNTPLRNGRSVFEAVWEYMLLASSPATGTRTQDDALPPVRAEPNPAENLLAITGARGEGSVRLFNALGQVVLEQKFASSPITLDVSSLPVGIYWALVGAQTGASSVLIRIAR